MEHASKHSDDGEGKPDLCLRVGSFLIIIEVKHRFKKHVEDCGFNPSGSNLNLDLSMEKIASRAVNGAFNYLIKGVSNNIDLGSKGITHAFFIGISMESEDRLIGRAYLISPQNHYNVRLPQFTSALEYFNPNNLRKVVSRADKLNELGMKRMRNEIASIGNLFKRLTGHPIDSYSTEMGMLLSSKLHWNYMINPRERNYDWFCVLDNCMDAFIEYCDGGNDYAYKVLEDAWIEESVPLKPIPFDEISSFIDKELVFPETIYGRLWSEMFHCDALDIGRILQIILPAELNKRVYDSSYGQCIASSKLVHTWFDNSCVRPGERFVSMVSDNGGSLLDKIASMMLFGMESVHMEPNDSKQRNKAAILICDQVECPSPEEQLRNIAGSLRCLIEGGTVAVAVSRECVESASMTELRRTLDLDLKLNMVIRTKGFYVLRFTKEHNRSGSKKVKITDVSTKRSIGTILDALKKPTSENRYERTLPDGTWFVPKVNKGGSSTPRDTNPVKKPSSAGSQTKSAPKKKTSRSSARSTGKTPAASKKPSATKKTPAKRASTSTTRKKPSTSRNTPANKTGGKTKRTSSSTRKTSSSTRKNPAKRTPTRK